MRNDWEESSTSPALKLAVAAVLVVGVAAIGFSWYTYQHGHTLVTAERNQRVADEAAFRAQLNALRRHDASVNGTIQSIETKQQNLAPLAKRVLKSVFSVFSDQELGTGHALTPDEAGAAGRKGYRVRRAKAKAARAAGESP